MQCLLRWISDPCSINNPNDRDIHGKKKTASLTARRPPLNTSRNCYCRKEPRILKTCAFSPRSEWNCRSLEVRGSLRLPNRDPGLPTGSSASSRVCQRFSQGLKRFHGSTRVTGSLQDEQMVTVHLSCRNLVCRLDAAEKLYSMVPGNVHASICNSPTWLFMTWWETEQSVAWAWK